MKIVAVFLMTVAGLAGCRLKSGGVEDSLTASVKFAGDGCFQTFVPGALYPVVCISGSSEEGIAGAGARVALFGTNTDQIIWYAKTTKISANETSTVYAFDPSSGMHSVTFKPTNKEGARQEGDITLKEPSEESKLKYLAIAEPETARFLRLMATSGKCK